MKKLLFSLFILFFSINISSTNANIDLVVSPIRYEIEAQPWETVTRSAKLINNSNNSYNITTSVSDFESRDSYWNPTFVRKSELVNPNQELASWITIDTDSFVIWWLEEYDITFQIEVPTDAVPGWHYWAVFFKTSWDDWSINWSKVQINADYWVLLLVNVDWEIIDNAWPWEPEINIWSSSSWGWYDWTKDRSENNVSSSKDVCKFWDFTSSDTDWKCFDTTYFEKAIEVVSNRGEKESDNISIENNNNNTELTLENNSELALEQDQNNKQNQENNSSEDNNEESTNNNQLATNNQEEEEDFNIEISIPFENNWNTHVKPEWKITLVDEDGNQIKWIWKEVIKDENWMITWEKIVDYIPINDGWWNILPNTKRIYTSEWKWFPYEDYDEDGKKIIKYWTPSEYYTNQNIADIWMIFPWQRVNERLEQKNVSAIIEIWYENYEWKDIEFNSAEEFQVDYKVKYVWLNPYFFILIWLISIFFIFIFILFRKLTRKKCHKCKKSIKKDMKICPYCWTKQKNKK